MMRNSSAGLSVLLGLVTLGCGGPAGSATDREAATRAYNEGAKALQSKDYQTASDKFTVALDSGYLNADRYVDASVKRAMSFAGLGDFDAAHAVLDDLEKDAPELDQGYAARSYVFAKQGQMLQADAAWKKARRVNRHIQRISY